MPAHTHPHTLHHHTPVRDAANVAGSALTYSLHLQGNLEQPILQLHANVFALGTDQKLLTMTTKPGRGTVFLTLMKTLRMKVKAIAFLGWTALCRRRLASKCQLSTFFASRCVYSRHCVRGWTRTLLQLSLRQLWSRLSWRVWDSRAIQTWATVLLLGSFLGAQKKKPKSSKS